MHTRIKENDYCFHWCVYFLPAFPITSASRSQYNARPAVKWGQDPFNKAIQKLRSGFPASALSRACLLNYETKVVKFYRLLALFSYKIQNGSMRWSSQNFKFKTLDVRQNVNSMNNSNEIYIQMKRIQWGIRWCRCTLRTEYSTRAATAAIYLCPLCLENGLRQAELPHREWYSERQPGTGDILWWPRCAFTDHIRRNR